MANNKCLSRWRIKYAWQDAGVSNADIILDPQSIADHACEVTIPVASLFSDTNGNKRPSVPGFQGRHVLTSGSGTEKCAAGDSATEVTPGGAPISLLGLATHYFFFSPSVGVSSKKFHGFNSACAHSVGIIGHSSARATWVVPVVIQTTSSWLVSDSLSFA